MDKVTSKDGTSIAYEKTGSGPALILIDGALCSRAFGPMPKLAPLLARHFTVFTYDRRGRGDSGDTQPYAREREIEDLAALLEAAGGSAAVAGISSGAALALEAAASGLNITKLAAYEPPYVSAASGRPETDHEANLKRLRSEGGRGDAVKYFLRDMMGAPGFVVLLMRLMPGAWRQLQAVAHTLPYDANVMRGYSVPTERFSSIRVPTLVMNGGKTDPRLKQAAEGVAKAVPNAQHRTLAGQTHDVSPKVLTPALVEFLT